MTRWKSIDVSCSRCGKKWDELATEKELEVDEFGCTNCGENTGKRVMSSPNVTRASYVDGTRRKGFRDLKEASKLNIQASNSRDETKKEIHKEIRKMRVDIKRDTPT